ncbi:alpha/beta hydrolase family protein [Kitasatospora sp. NPDC057223]|uniref:alpha/beta hydrolase family protein n=1 Tax=Kitasatospora sp. NPDC057223 TaxID=3346055 RepID=UPI00363A0669
MRWGTAAVVAAAAAGTGVAVLALGRRVSERAVHPGAGGAPKGAAQVRVTGLAAGRVTLTRTPQSARPGRYALEWGADGHAVVGDVLQSSPQGVTRRLERADGAPEPGTAVRLTPRVYRGDPGTALGLPFIETAANGEGGALPAWYVDGKRGIWVLLVHGPGADREQTLCAMPQLARLGLPVLSVTYRGDEGAPASPDGLGHFGETEWRDVEAAVRLALDSGAGRVVLYGWSLGATMALQTAARSTWASAVSGLILDSPVLDWPATVRRQATGAGVSAPLAALGALAAEGRSKVDLAGFARLAEGTDLQVPTLVLHSPADAVAPWQAAARLGERRADLVTLRPVPGAEHAALWNADPGGYEESLRRFLTPLL